MTASRRQRSPGQDQEPHGSGIGEDDLDIWLSSHFVEARGDVTTIDGLSDRVMKLVEDGRLVVIMGRNSNGVGRRGCQMAANDFHGALEAFRVRTGVDLTKVFPPPQELGEMLFHSRNIVRSETREGKRFVNRFVMVRVKGTPYTAHLSAGTGLMLNDALRQPHAVRLERVARQEQPGVFFAKRADRMVRSEMALSGLWNEVCHINRARGDIVVGDGRCGIWDLNHAMQPTLINLDIADAAREAATLKQKKADGQRRRTGAAMHGGLVDYSGSNPPPHGLLRFTDDRRNQPVLAIDEARLSVDLATVSGFPMIFDDNGERIYSAETVMTILDQWGRNGQDLLDLYTLAVRCRLSSQQLRAVNDKSTYYCGPTHTAKSEVSALAAGWARSFRGNLGFYRTGVLRAWVGPEPDDYLEVTDCFPERGYWLTKEALARIEVHEALRAARPARVKHTYSWGGLDCTLDGAPFFLGGRGWADPEEETEWLLRPASARRRHRNK